MRTLFAFFFLLAACAPARDSRRDSLHADSVRVARAGAAAALPPGEQDHVIHFEPFLPADDSVYPVFEIAPSLHAIVFTGSPEHYSGYRMSPLDTLLHQVMQEYYKGGEIYGLPVKGLADTSGCFNLLECPEATEAFAAFLKADFFIHCTKGIVKRKMQRVLVSLDMCQSSFVAVCFAPVDTVKYGHPLLASRRKLEPVNDPAATQALHAWHDSITPLMDYVDTLRPVIFARRGDSYFAYQDDFRWNRRTPAYEFCGRAGHICFPARSSYFIRPGRVEKRWREDLDLFGVPCD